MKSKLLIVFIFLLNDVLIASHVLPIRTMIIPLAKGSMCIDGIDDETWWSPEQSNDAFNPTGSTGADADYTFTFKVCFDATYLYIYGKILDDYESDWEWGGLNQWNFDNVEIFVDLDTNGSGNNPAYDSNTYQLRINRGIDSIGNDYGRGCMRSDHKYYWKDTADGWVFEAALNWRFVLGPSQKPEEILQYFELVSGFDVSGSDSDTDGADYHSCQTAWDNDDPSDPADRTEDNAWNNRTVFGSVTFEIYNCIADFNEIHADVKSSDNTNCQNLIKNATDLCSNNLDENPSAKIAFSPNPVADIIYFNNLQGSHNLKIINCIGQVVHTGTIDNDQLNVSYLKSGIYLLRIDNNTFKLIKE